MWLFQYEWWTHTCWLCTFLWMYSQTYIMCVFFPECHAAGWESGPEEPAQTTGNSKLQPAGSDSGCAETDCFFTGEQYNTTDTERQTAGTLHYTSYTIQYSVDSFSQRNTLQTDNKAASLAVYNWNVTKMYCKTISRLQHVYIIIIIICHRLTRLVLLQQQTL